jgi:hypothetical protein
MFASYSKHASVIKQFWYISHLIDYQVVDNISWIKYNIMNVELLRLDLVNMHHPFSRVSQIFESIVNLTRV